MGHKGNDEGINAKIRAKAQNKNKTNNGQPLNVGFPVQFVTAVNKNPATMAMVNPKTISWPCQTMTGMATETFHPATKNKYQTAIDKTAYTAAPRKKIRNPVCKITGQFDDELFILSPFVIPFS
jgi:hypothetical protein